MRCFFHLVDARSTISDEKGVEVSDLDHARAEALDTVREFRTEEPEVDVSEWKLIVADRAGTALFLLDLDDLDRV